MCGDSVRPLTKKQTEWIRKDSAKFIHFGGDKDTYNGYCDRCETEVHFDTKTKHNAKVKCPNCKHEMTVRHSWRGATEDVDFRVIVNVLDPYKVLYRYILIKQTGMERRYSEVARQLDDYEYMQCFYYEKEYGSWREGKKQQWFTPYNMGYGERKYCCLNGTVYKPGLKAELRKLNALKYIDDATIFMSNKWYVCSTIVQLSKYADIYEKLIKAGHSKFAVDEFHNWCGYWGMRKDYHVYDESQTSLIKMLKLNRDTYKKWQKYKTLTALKYLQKHSDIRGEVMEYAMKNNISIKDYDLITGLKLGHELKMLRYIKKQDTNAGEYVDYVTILKKLGYPFDNSYMFPKDFDKEYKRVYAEYNANREEIDNKYNNGIIKKISDALRNMKDLSTFLNGSKGLLVYVPDSVKDLKEEGKSLHNCIGNYVDRVVEGKTFVFFVRKLNAPDAPFVAFEYCNGEVIQCRADHNENVEDNNVIDFVEAFAERLRRNKVMVKAA